MARQSTPPPRAVAYVRVSTDQQRESGLGLEAQRDAIEQTATRLGLTVVGTFTDAGLSGTLSVEQRPALADAVNALRRGDVLIVAKRDRIARDAFVSVLIEREVTKKGCRIVSAAGEGTDNDDPASTFTRRILDAVGELERALTAARTRAALRAKRARGERAGTEPFGFRVNGDGRTLHAQPGEQATLAVIHECRAAGFSYLLEPPGATGKTPCATARGDGTSRSHCRSARPRATRGGERRVCCPRGSLADSFLFPRQENFGKDRPTGPLAAYGG